MFDVPARTAVAARLRGDCTAPGEAQLDRTCRESASVVEATDRSSRHFVGGATMRSTGRTCDTGEVATSLKVVADRAECVLHNGEKVLRVCASK